MVASLRRDGHHGLRAAFAALADGVGHFAGLAEADADLAAAVADDDQGAEIEAASAFDDLGGAVDEHDLLGQGIFLVFTAVIVARAARTTEAALATTVVPPALASRWAWGWGGAGAGIGAGFSSTFDWFRISHSIFLHSVKISDRPRARHRPAP